MLIDADPQASSMMFRTLRPTKDISAVSIIKHTLIDNVRSFSNFDLIFIDAGGRDNSLFRSAIACATYGLLLIPVVPSAVDMWATEDTLIVLREARSLGLKIPAYLLLNQIRGGTLLVDKAKNELSSLAEGYDAQVMEQSIGISEVFRHSFMSGQGVIEFEPAGKGAEEINALYTAIISYVSDDTNVSNDTNNSK